MQWNRRLFLRGALFAAIAVMLFCLLQVCYLPLGEVMRWRNFYAQPKNSIDVVFLGSSHSYHSFNPAVIDEIVPIRSHDVGIPGDNIEIVYHELQSVLRHQQPQIVFVDAFSLSMTNWLDGPYVYRFLNARFTPAHVLSSAEILLSNGYEWYNYFPYVRYARDRGDYAQLLRNPTDTTPPEYSENGQGFAGLTEIISDEKYASISTEDYLRPLPEKYPTYLGKVIELSREENFTLAFTDTLWQGFENPVYDLYERGEEFRLLSAEAISYYDFRSWPLAYDWTQIHLYDRDHPSEFGALIISVRTAELIGEMLDVPVDAERLAWYQQFYFDDFTLQVENDTIQLTLIPTNPDAPLHYTFTLLAEDTFTPLSPEEQSETPFFTVETPPPGLYWISAAVTQDGGDFTLRGLFPFSIPEN